MPKIAHQVTREGRRDSLSARKKSIRVGEVKILRQNFQLRNNRLYSLADVRLPNGETVNEVGKVLSLDTMAKIAMWYGLITKAKKTDKIPDRPVGYFNEKPEKRRVVTEHMFSQAPQFPER